MTPSDEMTAEDALRALLRTLYIERYGNTTLDAKQNIWRLFHLARREENEACAKVAELLAKELADDGDIDGHFAACQVCAAIRARVK